MSEKCYNCGIELNDENSSAEHVPAKNVYDGFEESFKKNRITVPACKKCNNKFSKIDQEIRDVLAVKNDDPEKKILLTQKGVRSILRRSNWKDRTYKDDNGNINAVDFNYDELKQIHIKNFKALFYRKYGIPVPDDFLIEILTEGDEAMVGTAQIIHDYVRDGKEWEVSGHEDVFKFILKDMTPDQENDTMYESGNFEELKAVAGVLVYHDEIAAVVVAGKKEYIESCKPKAQK